LSNTFVQLIGFKFGASRESQASKLQVLIEFQLQSQPTRDVAVASYGRTGIANQHMAARGSSTDKMKLANFASSTFGIWVRFPLRFGRGRANM
jgi:hypothetical protein